MQTFVAHFAHRNSLAHDRAESTHGLDVGNAAQLQRFTDARAKAQADVDDVDGPYGERPVSVSLIERETAPGVFEVETTITDESPAAPAETPIEGAQ